MFNTRWQCSRQTNSVGLRHLQLSDATNKLARVHQFTAVLSGSEHLGFWCWLMERKREREMLTDWILGGGGSASKSSSREKLEYLVCHVFSFVPTFGRQASQWKVVDLVRFLRFMSMRMQPNAHSPKSQTQVLVFCFFWRHHLFMHIFFKQTSRSHGSLYRSFFQPSKYHRIGLENLQETPILDGKNIKNHGFCRFALFANPLKIWVA